MAEPTKAGPTPTAAEVPQRKGPSPSGIAVDLYAAHGLSALLGILAVLLLAGVSPPAGAFLAVHTLAAKYTSPIYLEALPLLASLGAVLALKRSNGRDRWPWASRPPTRNTSTSWPGPCAARRSRTDCWSN